ncbi:DUF4240 domain-containing protein [Micromonospora chokoriensis]
MDVDDFWAVVESAGAGLDGRTGDDGEAVAAALVTRLAATSPEGILEFQDLFDQFHDALDRWMCGGWVPDRRGMLRRQL